MHVVVSLTVLHLSALLFCLVSVFYWLISVNDDEFSLELELLPIKV